MQLIPAFLPPELVLLFALSFSLGIVVQAGRTTRRFRLQKFIGFLLLLVVASMMYVYMSLRTGSGVYVTKVEKRECVGFPCLPVPPKEVPKPTLPFLKRNKSKLVAVGSTASGGSGGAFVARNRKLIMLFALLITVGAAVLLWHVIDEDTE